MSRIKEKRLYQSPQKNGVEVREAAKFRALYFDTILQSSMDLDRPHRPTLSYIQQMLFPLLLTIPKRILIIGLGGGSLARFFAHNYPQAKLEAVEISAEVIDIAKEYFALPEQLILHCDCGEKFLRNSMGQYDLIYIDAYHGRGMASELYSRETFQLCQQHLSDKGILCCNLWSGDRRAYAAIKQSLEIYKETIYIPVPEIGNIISISSQQEVDWQNLHPRKQEITALSQHHDIDFTTMVKRARTNNISLWQRACNLI